MRWFMTGYMRLLVLGVSLRMLSASGQVPEEKKAKAKESGPQILGCTLVRVSRDTLAACVTCTQGKHVCVTTLLAACLKWHVSGQPTSSP